MSEFRLKTHVPDGTQDFLRDSCRVKRTLEKAVLDEFRAHGYDEIETPVFEYDEVFMRGSMPYVDESVLRFFEPGGRILTLRPDMTGPIARIAASRLLAKKSSLRLCYVGNVYGRKREGHRVETTQAGIELIGPSGANADAEIIGLAAEALLAADVSSFVIDVGHVKYFEGLVGDAGLSGPEAEIVRALIDAKNNVELSYELQKLDIAPEARDRLIALPSMFGGPEILDVAYTGHPLCLEAVDNLRAIVRELQQCGLGGYVSLDLGMLHNFNYYTGVVFRGLAEGSGRPILSGGRYDELLGEFGCPAHATGFAVDITALTAMRCEESDTPVSADATVLLRFSEGDRGRAFEYARSLRKQGRSVILAPEGWDGVPPGAELRLPAEDGSC